MKRKLALLLSLVAGVALLAACGSTTSSSSAVSSESASATSSEPASTRVEEASSAVPVLEDMVYRGQVTDITDMTFTVEQLPGFNYGFSSVVFNLATETVTLPEGAELAVGGFVEVTYDGVMTRSMPPIATAQEINVLSSQEDLTAGIIVNGTIETVETIDENFYITILPFDATATEPVSVPEGTGRAVLIVPVDALEFITEADLVEGTKVSAVTNGIAAMSEPPQMPVQVLLPFNWEEIVE